MKKIMIKEAGHFCKGFSTFVAAAIFLAASPSISAAVDMVEGEWENVAQMMMEGMPFSLPPVTTTQCLSRKDLVPGKDGNPDCSVIEQKISGNTMHWKAICKDREGASEVNGEITYAGKSYKGDTRVLITDRRGRATTMTMKMTGRYLGPCTGSGTTVNGVPLDSI
jgi:hypothetical protein